MEGCNATIKRQVVEFEQRQSPQPPFSALWAARLLSTQSGKHLVLICKLFGLSNFWIISSHPAFWLTAKLLILPERDVPWVGNLLGRSLSITAGTFTALLFLSIWIHWYWIWNTLKLKLKLNRKCQHFIHRNTKNSNMKYFNIVNPSSSCCSRNCSSTVAVAVAVAGLQDPCWALAYPRIMRRGNHTHRRLITMMIIMIIVTRKHLQKGEK